MTSSSESRSRSARRSPSRRDEGEAKASKPEKSEAPSTAPESKEGEKPGRWDEWNTWVPETEETKKESSEHKARAARTRSAGGGAVRNRRAAGTPGTFQCPDCYRVIQDNRTSREQHRDSRHCRAHRLHKRGYGSMEQCLQLADHEISKQWQKWSAGQSVRLTEKPNEPKGPPPKRQLWHGPESSRCERQPRETRYHEEDYRRERRSPEQDYRRERRSPDRNRRSSRNAKRDHEESRRADRRKKTEKAPHARAEDARKSSRSAGAKEGKEKDTRRRETKRDEGEETHGSSDYTYTYDESSSAEESKDLTQKKSASASATKAASEEPCGKKPEKSRPVVGQSAPSPARPKGKDQENRVAMFNSLLRTAMETADLCGM